MVKNLSAAEVEYLIKYEFARRAEDILWRRTKLGLYFSQQQTRILEKWINDNLTNIFGKNMKLELKTSVKFSMTSLILSILIYAKAI